jgi:predicted AlkP superfamily pyrophosphatase or phosphodiesterase
LILRKPSSKQFHAGIVAILGFCSLALLTLAGCKASSSSPRGPATVQQSSTPRIAESTVKPQPLNVILITLDTVRADHLHCYGANKIKTPVIDGLARDGVLFETAVTQTPLTGPSHASIFTGENPNVHHVRDTGGFAMQ